MLFKKILTILIIFFLIGISKNSSEAVENQLNPKSLGKIFYVGGSGEGNYTNIQDAIIPVTAENISRDDLILIDYRYNGLKQAEIAKKYGISEGRASQIISKKPIDEITRNELRKTLQKETAILARSKAYQIIASIRPEKLPEGTKSTSAGSILALLKRWSIAREPEALATRFSKRT